MTLEAENARLREQVACLQRVIGYLRADVRAAAQRRDAIRHEAERDLMRALEERT